MRFALLFVGLVPFGAWMSVGRGHSSQEPLPPPAAVRTSSNAKPGLLGPGSCAAMACHNADGAGFQKREYKIALERDFSKEVPHNKDKHAQAYAVLFEERSLRIVRHLQNLPSNSVVHPEREHKCLVCHVHPEYQQQPVWMRAEGVSCEGCHGPAERWLAAHFRPGFKNLTADGRQSFGMNDTRSLAGRVRACVQCHIGTKDADVNHDLIAAGHPRLDFEFSAFHHEWHKHWDTRKDKDPTVDSRGRKDFEALSWAYGQIASAEAALKLLVARAGDASKPWMEFAEYNCFACHHDIKENSWRQQRYQPGQVGKLTWSPWHYALLGEAIEALGPADPSVAAQLGLLTKELESPRPDRDKTAKLAGQTAALLTAILQRSQASAAPLPVDALLKKAIERADAKSTQSWDHAKTRYAAVAALARAQSDLGRRAPNLDPLAKLLGFPLGFDSPREYDPAKVEEAFRNLK